MLSAHWLLLESHLGFLTSLDVFHPFFGILCLLNEFPTMQGKAFDDQVKLNPLTSET